MINFFFILVWFYLAQSVFFMDPEKVVMICFISYIYFLYYMSRVSLHEFFLTKRQYVKDLILISYLIKRRTLKRTIWVIKFANNHFKELYRLILLHLYLALSKFFIKNLLQFSLPKSNLPFNNSINLTFLGLCQQIYLWDDVFCSLLSIRFRNYIKEYLGSYRDVPSI